MIKQTLIATVGLVLLGFPLNAGEVVVINSTPAEKWFDSEIQFDLIGTYQDQVSDFGGGLGVNYFINENFGVGIDTLYNGEDNLYEYSTSLNVIYRYPFEQLALAPYVVGGVGYTWDGDEVLYSVGAGVDYRLAENIGVFVEGRYNWFGDVDSDPSVRAGFRFTF
jgi:opacity protein-like surface antigen